MPFIEPNFHTEFYPSLKKKKLRTSGETRRTFTTTPVFKG